MLNKTAVPTAVEWPEAQTVWQEAEATREVTVVRPLHLVESISELQPSDGGSNESSEGRVGSNRCSRDSQSASTPGAVLGIVARSRILAENGRNRVDESRSPWKTASTTG